MPNLPSTPAKPPHDQNERPRRCVVHAMFGVLGFLLLAGGTVALYVYNLSAARARSLVFMVLAGLLLVGIGIEMAVEWRRFRADPGRDAPLTARDCFDGLAVFGGALVTFVLSVHLGLGAVTASALVGLVAARGLQRHAVAVYCGSFVGMASADVMCFWPCIVLAGMAAGLVFMAARRVFNGVGGKLGTTALIGCLTVVFAGSRPLLRPEMPAWNVGIWMLFYAMAGAVVTFMLSVRFQRGPVMASALVGLAAGLLLPRLHGVEPGAAYAAVVFSASFVGMCGTERLAGEHWMAVAGLICGLAFIQTSPYFAGAGGKLGTLAFGAVISLRGLQRIAGAFQRGYSSRWKVRNGIQRPV